jgi:hypothetical protein
MSGTAKHEYLAAIKPRYRKASRKEKKAMLEELCTICVYHRKYAIRVLNATERPPHPCIAPLVSV